eukprot:3501097-Amphidinium_carterae.1
MEPEIVAEPVEPEIVAETHVDGIQPEVASVPVVETIVVSSDEGGDEGGARPAVREHRRPRWRAGVIK